MVVSNKTLRSSFKIFQVFHFVFANLFDSMVDFYYFYGCRIFDGKQPHWVDDLGSYTRRLGANHSSSAS
jgi:hypothetical protein